MGHDRGDPDQPALRWSEAEAREFADLMTQVGSVAPEDATVLLAPTPDALRDALDALTARVRMAPERTEVLLYLSGHARNGALSLGGDALPLPELRSRIEALPADVVVTITDACTSASLLRRKGVSAVGGFALQPVSSSTKGRAWIASAGPSEPAFESDHAGGSLFARHLFAGLRGAADADDDGVVTLSEAYGFLYRRTLADSLARAGTPQQAHLETDLVGAGELAWTEPGRSGARLILPEDLAGAEVWIIDADAGRAVVQLESAHAGQAIALRPGTWSVYTRRDGRARVRTVTLRGGDHRLAGEGQLASLDPVRTRGGGVLPRRWELGARLRVRGPLTKGSATTLGGGVALEGQLLRWLRLGGSVSVLGGRFQAARERIRQVEVGADAGAWFSPAGRVQPLVGGRIGLVGISQLPEAPEASWYGIGADPSAVRSALSPDLTLETGLVLRLGTHVVARIGIEGSLLVLPSEDGPTPRVRWGAALTLGATP